MTTTPTWFGEPARPLFGWLHQPDDGMARGLAVCCAPLGREAANALPAFQVTCDQLVESGIAALRFDYAGTGDSAGSLDDPGRLADWLTSIDEALLFARRIHSGPVVLVGMRMGALLAAEAVARGAQVDGLIHWDPCASGRDFLRTEQTLLATSYGAQQIGDGSVAGPAFTYTVETVGDLSPLKLAPGPTADSPRIVVLARVNAFGMTAARKRFAFTPVDWMEVDGQAELIDAYPDTLVLPTTAIKAVCEATGRCIDGPATAVRLQPEVSAEVLHCADGSSIIEHPVRLGPNALFAMMTEPSGAEGPAPTTVVFLSAGALDHTGPGRRWVTMARRFAADGISSVRVDIDGIGETFGRPGMRRQQVRPPEAIDDLTDIAEALGDPDGRHLVFVGLSSGAYHAIEAGLHLHPKGICALNPNLVGWMPELEHGAADPRRRAFRRMPKVLRPLAVRHVRVATWLWWALLQVWVKGSPHYPVTKVSRRGTPVLLIIADWERQQFEPSIYWSAVERSLHRRGLLTIERVDGLDHSLYTVEGQTQAYPLFAHWVTSRFGRPAGNDGRGVSTAARRGTSRGTRAASN